MTPLPSTERECCNGFGRGDLVMYTSRPGCGTVVALPAACGGPRAMVEVQWHDGTRSWARTDLLNHAPVSPETGEGGVRRRIASAMPGNHEIREAWREAVGNATATALPVSPTMLRAFLICLVSPATPVPGGDEAREFHDWLDARGVPREWETPDRRPMHLVDRARRYFESFTPPAPGGGDGLAELLHGAAHHLRNLPVSREGDDVRWAERLEQAAKGMPSLRVADERRGAGGGRRPPRFVAVVPRVSIRQLTDWVP